MQLSFTIFGINILIIIVLLFVTVSLVVLSSFPKFSLFVKLVVQVFIHFLAFVEDAVATI